MVVVLAQEPQEIDAVPVRKPHIEQARIRAIGSDARAEFRRRPADENLVAFAFQYHLERKPNVRFIVNDENAFGSHMCVCLAAAYAFGNTTLNAAPPSWLSTIVISPPLRSALFRAID